jgi:hypothetical protein
MCITLKYESFLVQKKPFKNDDVQQKQFLQDLPFWLSKINSLFNLLKALG